MLRAFLHSHCLAIWLATLLALPVTPYLASAQNSASPDSRAALRSAEDDYWAYFQRENPEAATALGQYQYNNQLSDLSLAHVPVAKAESSRLLARFRAIDPKPLSESDQLDRTILVRTLEREIRGIDLKTYEMPIDQFNGVHLMLAQLTALVPLDTVKHYEDYIARLNQVPSRFDQIIEVLKAGERDHLMPPKFLLELTVGQCANVADPAGEANPFGAPATRIPSTFSAADKKRLHDAILTAVDGQVRPAYRKLQTFIAQDYAPKGRLEPGFWSLPNGDELYQYAVESQTTSDLSPDQIHELGLAQVADLEAQITALAKKAGYPDSKTFIAAVKADPKMTATSREQILDNFRRYITQMQPKLPQLFGILPKNNVTVASVPAYMEKESSTQYMNGTPDGSRPGQVWVDTYDPTHHSTLDDEATAYHEGIPGHHMQISIAQELPNRHPFHLSIFYNAYVEGWALYAERLGKEVGFYQEPASDLGRLQSELFRAIRLVVDTGVHRKHWTRAQMVTYFEQHYGEALQSEIDRYIALPGQALGYKMGQLKILELRSRAKDQLGDKFDIKAFHDEILNAGALPLDLLDARVTRWLKEQSARPSKSSESRSYIR